MAAGPIGLVGGTAHTVGAPEAALAGTHRALGAQHGVEPAAVVEQRCPVGTQRTQRPPAHFWPALQRAPQRPHCGSGQWAVGAVRASIRARINCKGTVGRTLTTGQQPGKDVDAGLLTHVPIVAHKPGRGPALQSRRNAGAVGCEFPAWSGRGRRDQLTCRHLLLASNAHPSTGIPGRPPAHLALAKHGRSAAG